MHLDRAHIERAWTAAIAGLPVEPNSVRPYILESWRRCLALGIDPQTNRPRHVGEGEPLAAVLRAHESLLATARHTWCLLADTLATSECILVLVSREGIELEVYGNPDLVRAARHEGVGIGYDWSEASAGTNAVATTLALNQPTIVRSVEHFCLAAKMWDCAAAPIRDLDDGSLLGLLDVTSIGELSDNHTLALAVTAAQQIEHTLHSLQLAHSVQLLNWYRNAMPEWRGQPAILVDRKGRVVATSERVRALAEHVPSTLAIVAGRPQLPADSPLAAQDVVAYPAVAPPMPKGLDGPPRWDGGIVVVGRCRRPGRRRESAPASGDCENLSAAFRDLHAGNPGLHDAVLRADRMARTAAPVLLTGETGSGKELFARAIHGASAGADGPFVAVNCGALSKDLAASELLGYEAGAFTGASSKGRRGKFEEAAGGTLFLDEVGDLPLDIQVQLLRVLQDRVVVRLGGNEERRVDVRIIAATNRDLERDVDDRLFRLDLYYRLKVLSLKLPPLRERKADIAMLVNAFLCELQAVYGLGRKIVSGDLMQLMMSHPWPGNVRELRGFVESMYILSRRPLLTPADLPEDFARGPLAHARCAPSSSVPPSSVPPSLAAAERGTIEQAVEYHGRNLAEAARHLGVSRSTLYRKLKEYGSAGD